MDSEEPLRKRLKLSPSGDGQVTKYQKQPLTDIKDLSSIVIPEKADSSFTFIPAPLRNSRSSTSDDYILDIRRYIPAGCLRIQKYDCAITSEVWKSCHSWRAFAHPRDVYNSNGGPYLLNALQEILFDSTTLQPYRGLHNSGWIRMEFKMKDQHFGQVRVYILPDDVGRGAIDRQQASLRRTMQLLLAQIDISNATWNGDWSDHTPVAHVDSYLDELKVKDDASLFYIFNTIQSPKPDPEIVANRYARDAMYSILENDIEGLTTKMYTYQRRSAAMMLQREAQPAQIIDPRLRPVVDQKGNIWYCDLDASSCLREPRTYEAAKGGICAETMGLGKTLICLALIMATRELSSHIPAEYSLGTIPVRKTTGSLLDMSAATIGRTGTPWKVYFSQMEAEGYDFSQCREAIRRGAGHYYLPGPEPRRESRKPIIVPPRKIWLSAATIVVVPPNLVQQWRQEVKKHTTGLKVLVMNSLKAPLPPAEELSEYDLILFSKQRFDKEAKDGSDDMGRRRTTTSSICHCPYIGSTRERDCTCFREEDVYRSPLKDIHFKRLITDEGHAFGNSSKSSRTEALTVVDFLQLSARWIVSGTPTRGLYGVEVATASSEDSSTSGTPLQTDAKEKSQSCAERYPMELPDLLESTESVTASETSSERERLFFKQEREDLEKLGNIATFYLKARPWANTYEDNDSASWAQHVMQPRHGSKSHGNMDCLRSTLEGMIIRHRPEDVMADVTLPPMYQDIVYLDGSIQDKLALNMFSMMIVSNAVTSERKDADYLFHPRQRKALAQLVSNLRQASFFWSGYTAEDVQVTIDIAKKFLENKEVPVNTEDERLLLEAVKVGEGVLSNTISKALSQMHEMPMYIQNECPDDIRAAWSLDGASTNPTLMGATMVHAAQKFVESQSWKEDPTDGMVVAGESAMKAAHELQEPQPVNRTAKINGKEPKTPKKAAEPAPALAGGVTVGDGSTPKKRPRSSSGGSRKQMSSGSQEELVLDPAISELDNWVEASARKQRQLGDTLGWTKEKLGSLSVPKKSALKKSVKSDISGTLDPSSPLASTFIVSTSSAKLSYLMDRIMVHHQSEKILVFYEADNVAYYIAQALECLGIKHLIYAKTLSSARRAQYLVTFNQIEVFRVLLMDVSQAAYGLDISSASRVYFVNPVFDPRVEAQALKRAHRIGQTKPVYVETLILKGSIEEVILERGKAMSNEEHNKCKNILDDQTMYDWIRNVRFFPISTEDVPGSEQMAKLETPQLVFCRGGSKIGAMHDPDADLVLDELTPKAKGKRKTTVKDDTSDRESTSTPSKKAKGKSRMVSFVGLQKEDDIARQIRQVAGPHQKARAEPESMSEAEVSSETESDAQYRPEVSDLAGYISTPEEQGYNRRRTLERQEVSQLLASARRARESEHTTKSRMDDVHRRLAFAPSDRRFGPSHIASRRPPLKAKNGESSSASPSTEHEATVDDNGVKSLVVTLKLGQNASIVPEIAETTLEWRQHLVEHGYEFTPKGWKEPPESWEIGEDVKEHVDEDN